MTTKHVVMRGLSPLARLATRRSARILMYHRFAAAPAPRFVSAPVFERQVSYIARYFKACRLSDLAGHLDEDRLPSDLVVLTVDDGYDDFREIAYPILQRYRVPVTIFVTTRFADQTCWLWFDAIRYVLGFARDGVYQLDVCGRPQRVTISDPASRELAWNQLADLCVPLSPSQRTDGVWAIMKAFRVPLPVAPTSDYRAMTWAGLRALDAALVEIGSHTCTHPVLSHCSAHEQRYEIVDSKAVLEEQLQRRIESFCYPNGQPSDYDDGVARVVREAGYTSAVVAHGTYVVPRADRFRLERVCAPEDPVLFRNVVDGYPHMMRLTTDTLRGLRNSELS